MRSSGLIKGQKGRRWVIKWIGRKTGRGGGSGQTLDKREQANDGLRVPHAAPPSPPGESLVSALLSTPSCQCHAASCSHSHGKHTDRRRDITQTHPLSIASSFIYSYAYKHECAQQPGSLISSTSRFIQPQCPITWLNRFFYCVTSHLWPVVKVDDQSLFPEEITV